MRLSLGAAAAISLCGVFAVAAPVLAAAGRHVTLPPLTILEATATSTVKRTQALWNRFDVGGGRLAIGELTGDARNEIVLAEGLGKEPRIRVFTDGGRELSSFLAYDKKFDRGVSVAVGDVNDDDSRDIVTGTGFGGGPHVRVWDRSGRELFAAGGFFAFDVSSRAGVNVSLADFDGDGAKDIVAAQGFGGLPEIRVFRPDGAIVQSFMAFAPEMTSGVSATGVDIDGDGVGEIAAAREVGGPAEVRVFRLSGANVQPVISFTAGLPGDAGGISLSAGDIDGDGREEIVVTQNAGGAVRVYSGGGVLRREFSPYKAGAVEAVQAALGDIDADGRADLVAAPAPPLTDPAPAAGKRIEVHLATQQLYAWENGRLANTFLVSSGTKNFPSPTGTFAVFRKVAKMDYRWSYSPGNPNNYNLPNVPWNLNFTPRYYIHDAYWHNNFGVPMSHGCINVSLATSKWIYDWAEVGTPVLIR